MSLAMLRLRMTDIQEEGHRSRVYRRKAEIVKPVR